MTQECPNDRHAPQDAIVVSVSDPDRVSLNLAFQEVAQVLDIAKGAGV